MAILSLVIAQVLSRQQKLQGKQHELARKRSQEGSASVSWRFPGARKVRTCWQAGRAVSPALCHKSLCEGCWLWQSGERAVLHHTWLLLNTSVLHRSLSHPRVIRGCFTSVSTEGTPCFARSQQKLSADTCADYSGYFFTTVSFQPPCYQLLPDAVVQVILFQTLWFGPVMQRANCEIQQ